MHSYFSGYSKFFKNIQINKATLLENDTTINSFLNNHI